MLDTAVCKYLFFHIEIKSLRLALSITVNKIHCRLYRVNSRKSKRYLSSSSNFLRAPRRHIAGWYT